jgi:acyl dehydratase
MKKRLAEACSAESSRGPVRPGDVLHVESEIVEVIPSRSGPDRGTVVVRSETRNQRGEVVQTAAMKLLVPRRSHQPAGGSNTEK